MRNILDAAASDSPGGPRAALLDTNDPVHWHRCARELDALRDSVPARRTSRVAVVSPRGCDLLAELLPVAALCVGIRVEVAAFGHRHPEQLLPPADELSVFAPDHVVLSGTEEDLALNPSRPEESVREAVQRWRALWLRLRDALGCRVVQQLFAPPAHDPHGDGALAEPTSHTAMVRRVNEELRARAGHEVLTVDGERLATRDGLVRWHDPRNAAVYGQPVALSALPELAKAIAGALAADLGTTRRCVVLDADNTLWDGVVGESGIAGVGIDGGGRGDGFRAFQRYLLGLRDRGVVLALASKNDPDLAHAALAEVPGMLLRPEHFAAVVAGWQPKSVQVREVLRRLRLSPEALVFVDDDPAECAEVATELPDVDVVWLAADPFDHVAALADRPTLAVRPATAEDRLRAASYAGLAQAEAHRGPDVGRFLDSLHMVAEVRPLEDQDLTRAAQLIQRANQFHLTSRRHDEAALDAMATSKHWDCLTLRLRDRYADHGLVGVLAQHRTGDIATIDTLVLSCRVIGRTAERVLLHAAGKLAWRRGCTHLRGVYRPSPRNHLVRDLYERLGFTTAPGSPEGVRDFDLSGLPQLGTPHIAEGQYD